MNMFFYGHTGANNHGCEAIVRGTVRIYSIDLRLKYILFSYQKYEDDKYELQKISTVKSMGKTLKRYSVQHFILKLKSVFQKQEECYANFYYKNLLNTIQQSSFYVSLGGDMYCYKGSAGILAVINKRINEKNSKTILWGCSIEPDLLKNLCVVEDLHRYSLITPRESITYKALLDAGINKNTKLFPDPAFALDTVKLELPKGFTENNTIGINVSPLIIDCETNKGATMQNYTALIQHIIDTTDMQIALIPHVVWETNDDRKPLRDLYNKFSHTGRIVMIEDHNCMELKGYIARCRIFIGARTHATIAAYSSCVPTLVVGYSVKAKGIAKDIFGTYENYVIPVQTLANKDDLIHAFEWLENHEKEISVHLKDFMPSYIEKAYEAGKEVEKLIENRGN